MRRGCRSLILKAAGWCRFTYLYSFTAGCARKTPEFLLISGLLLSIVHFFWGGLVQATCLNDHAFACDYTYRIYGGQMPFRDFYTAIGSFPFILSAAFWRVAGAEYANLTKAWGIFGSAFGLFIYFLCRRKVGRVLAAVYAFCVYLLLSGLNRLDDGATMLSVAMIYNRFGWAFVAAMLPLLYCAGGGESMWERFFSGVFTGLCLFATVFCKINFFAAGVFMILGSYLAGERRPDFVFWRGALAAFTISALAGWFSGLFSIPDYLNNVRILARSSSAASFLFYSLNTNIRYAAEVFPALACVLAAASFARVSIFSRAAVFKSLLTITVFLWISAGGLIFSATNNEKGLIVLMPFAALIFISRLTSDLGPGWARLKPAGARGALFFSSAALFLLSAAWVPTSLISIPYSWAAFTTAVSNGRPENKIGFPASRGVLFEPKGGSWVRRDDRSVAPEDYTAWASAAARLLAQFGIKGSCVVLSSFNPADFLAGARPAKGVPINWVFGEFLKERDLPELSPRTGQQFLLEPKKIFTESDLALANHYRARLGCRLILLGENEYWMLYKIKDDENLDRGSVSRL